MDPFDPHIIRFFAEVPKTFKYSDLVSETQINNALSTLTFRATNSPQSHMAFPAFLQLTILHKCSSKPVNSTNNKLRQWQALHLILSYSQHNALHQKDFVCIAQQFGGPMLYPEYDFSNQRHIVVDIESLTSDGHS